MNFEDLQQAWQSQDATRQSDHQRRHADQRSPAQPEAIPGDHFLARCARSGRGRFPDLAVFAWGLRDREWSLYLLALRLLWVVAFSCWWTACFSVRNSRS